MVYQTLSDYNNKFADGKVVWYDSIHKILAVKHYDDPEDPNIIQIGNYIIGYDFSYDNMFGGRRFVLSYPETIQLYRQRGLFDVQIAIWDRKKLKRYRKIVNG
jgi:hypothetical protein